MRIHILKRLALAATLFFALGGVRPMKACFEIIPTIHSVTCYYDSLYQDFVVRVGSLRLSTNPPGKWCTCALHNNSPIFDQIQYIAIVDSGTNHRVDGLAQWYPSAMAAAGWDSIYPIHWFGYLTQVEGNGTVGIAPVELVIRAHFPPGYAYVPMFDDIRTAILGWGSWNDTLQRPNNDRWWADWPLDTNFHFVAEPNRSFFFSRFDADLLYTGTSDPIDLVELAIYPNPATDILNLRFSSPSFAFRSLDIYDANGRRIQGGFRSGKQDLTIDVSTLPSGTYFVRIETGKGWVTRRFLRG